MGEYYHPGGIEQEKHGGLRMAAKAIKVSASYLGRLRDGYYDKPDNGVLRKLGLKRVVKYVPIEHKPKKVTGGVMPKLNECFHKPRVEAYQIAIDAIERAWEQDGLSYERHVEYRRLMTKLEKDKQSFIEKFDVSPEPKGDD